MQFPPADSHVLPAAIRLDAPPINSGDHDKLKKVIGSLVGLAIGDALGASVEFRPRQYLVEHPIDDFQSGGTWGLQAGQWTDDTSMALCLASSLITQRGFNSYDQMVRYKWWYKKGFLSSTGECFDIGSTTRTSVEEFSRRQNILKQHFRNSTDEYIDNLPLEQVRSVKSFSEVCGVSEQAGNGPLMRLAPIPLFYFRQPELAVRYAGESARLTHSDPKAVDSCRYYAALIVAAIHGASKEELLDEQFYEKHQPWFGTEKLNEEVLHVAQGSYKRPRGYDDGIRGKSYIVNTLEAALWAFCYDENSFKKGVLQAVNLGDDTDTTAAVYGQLAGAYYTLSHIPMNWIERLYAGDLIICVSEWLYFGGGQSPNNTTRQQQQQKQMPQRQQQKQMTQQQNQTRMPPSKPGQAYGPYSSTQQPSAAAAYGRVGYGTKQPTTSQHTGAYTTFQTDTNSNAKNSGLRGEKKKLDPSKLPSAGVSSGHLQ